MKWSIYLFFFFRITSLFSISLTLQKFFFFNCILRNQLGLPGVTLESSRRKHTSLKQHKLVNVPFYVGPAPFGSSWVKHYCTYRKETKKFTMIPFEHRSGGKAVSIFLYFTLICTLYEDARLCQIRCVKSFFSPPLCPFVFFLHAIQSAI